MTAKAESIADGEVDIPSLRLVESEVEGRDLGVVGEMVDCRRDNAILDGKDGGDGLHSSGSTQQMARHRFGGIDGDLVSIIAKESHDSLRLRNVANGRRGAMGIDVIHIGDCHTGLFYSLAHGADDAQALGERP